MALLLDHAAQPPAAVAVEAARFDGEYEIVFDGGEPSTIGVRPECAAGACGVSIRWAGPGGSFYLEVREDWEPIEQTQLDGDTYVFTARPPECPEFVIEEVRLTPIATDDVDGQVVATQLRGTWLSRSYFRDDAGCHLGEVVGEGSATAVRVDGATTPDAKERNDDRTRAEDEDDARGEEEEDDDRDDSSEGNRPPSALPDRFEGTPGTPLEIAMPGVLGNDEDPDGDTIVAIALSSRSQLDGTLRVRPNGSISFTPAGEGIGALCFEYVARDEHGALSERAAVVVLLGDADESQVTNDDGGCAVLAGDDEEETTSDIEDAAVAPASEQVIDLEGRVLEDEAEAAGPPLEHPGRDLLLAMPSGAFQGAGDLASLALHGAGLYDYWVNPASCDASATRRNPLAGTWWYGHITTRVAARRNYEHVDYVRFRSAHFRNREFIAVHPWRYRRVSQMTPYGRAFFDSQVRFGHPNATYAIAVQVQWFDDRFPSNLWWGDGRHTWAKGRVRDKLLADTGWLHLRGACRSGNGFGLGPG